MSGKPVDLGAQFAYGCRGLADLAVRASVRLSPRGVQEASGSRPGLAASPCSHNAEADIRPECGDVRVRRRMNMRAVDRGCSVPAVERLAAGGRSYGYGAWDASLSLTGPVGRATCGGAGGGGRGGRPSGAG